MLIRKNYINGKYDPLELNAILLDSRAGFGKLIPDDFQKIQLWHYVISSLRFLYRNIKNSLLQAPSKYKFAWITKYGYLYNNTLLFNLPTVNNQKAYEKIIANVERVKDNVRIITEFSYDNYPKLWIYVISFFYLPFLWLKFKKSSNADRRIIAYNLYDFIIAPGLTFFYFSICRRYKPECVLLSNDHRIFTKTLELVCEDCGIKTIYVQHASVSYAFPELHFTYSFLDGMDALQKYTDGDKQSKGNIFLLGAIRYDGLSAYRLSRRSFYRGCIGVAINLLDDNNITNKVCNLLLEKYPNVKLKIRSHPAMLNNPFLFDNSDRIIYTCASNESMVDYLDSIDLQIASDSGIHFDAIIGGVKTVAYNLSKSVFGDNYNYVKNGMLAYANDFETLDQIISSSYDNIVDENIVRFYDEAFGKTYAGRCSEIVSEFILNGFNIESLHNRYGLIEWDKENVPCFMIPS